MSPPILPSIKCIGISSRATVRSFLYALKRSIGLPYAHLKDVAVRSQILCNGGELPAITPYFWDFHLQRIRGAARHSAEYVINHDLNRKTFEFRPVVAYWLENATLFGGSVYVGRFRKELRPLGSKPWVELGLNGAIDEIQQGALVSTCAGSTWWGHWLEDEVPLQILAEKFSVPVAHNRKSYRDEACYRAAFGISEPQRYGFALINELLVVDDFAQNPDKTRRYHALRRHLANLPQGCDRVFLSRGNSGVRRILVNEDEVRTQLESMGFKTIEVSSNGADEVIKVCRGASIVVSVEGSHLAPLLYLMREFGTLVILNPPYQVHTTIADIGVFCGLSSGMFICEPDGESKADFRADPKELAKFVDEISQYGVSNRPRLEHFLAQVELISPPAVSY